MLPFDVTKVPLSGLSLVEASAGTGKTHAIATLYVRLLLEANLAVDQIAVVTFTEAATRELKDRIRCRLVDALSHLQQRAVLNNDDPLVAIIKSQKDPRASAHCLESQLNCFDDARISTIHGFCQRVLQECPFESGAPFHGEFIEDVRPLIEELLLDYWSRSTHDAPLAALAWLKAHKFDLETARKLVSTASTHLGIVVVPAQVAAVTVDSAAYHSAFQAAAEHWNKGDLVELLRGRITKNTKHWESRYPKLDEFFKGAGLIPTVEQLKYFESATVAKSISGKLPNHPFFQACDRLIQLTPEYEAQLEQWLLAFKWNCFQFVEHELQRRKAQRNVLSFDDLLRLLHSALHAPGGEELARSIGQRYRVTLVDEFQDTDQFQYAIFKRLATTQLATFLIGDPKQAIYSFRGADVFAYIAAAQATQATQHFTMGVNYRSDPTLVDAVSALFQRTPLPFLLEDIQLPAVRAHSEQNRLTDDRGTPLAPFELLLLADYDAQQPDDDEDSFQTHKSPLQQTVAELVANDIARLLNESPHIKSQPIRPRDVAVLTRTNVQAFAVQDALRRVGIHSVVVGDRSVYLAPEAADLERILGAALEPGNGRALRAALCTDLLGFTAAQLLALDQDEPRWDQIVSDFKRYNALWTGHGFVQMVHSLLAEYGVESRLLGFPDGERRLTNLMHLVELLHTAASLEHLGPNGVVRTLNEQRREQGYATDSEQIRLESDEDAVTLTTIHKSKGLEYPIVYCPYLFRDSLRHSAHPTFYDTGAAAACIDLGSANIAAHRARQHWETFAENLRLLYVALTRARHRVTVVWGRAKGFENAALSYLLFPPDPREQSATCVDIAKYLRALDDAACRKALEQLAASTGIVVRTPNATAVQYQGGRSPSAASLAARVPSRPVAFGFRTASFSSLSQERRDAALEPAEGRDWDERASALDRPPSVETANPALAGKAALLLDFPRGARAGNFFHELLQDLDFTQPDQPAASQLLASLFSRYGYEGTKLTPTVQEALTSLLATPLVASSSLTLGNIPSSARLNELEFILPAAHSAANDSTQSFRASDLANVFTQHPSSAVPASYSMQLGNLSFLPLQGFLKGYIDLVFRHDDRYYLVDYKTNHLGDSLADYTPDKLQAVMANSHYFLQYHLYALALHRYLQARKANYDYARDFGGVLYLFIKGMRPESGPSSGVFFEQPPRARIDALSEALTRPQVPS